MEVKDCTRNEKGDSADCNDNNNEKTKGDSMVSNENIANKVETNGHSGLSVRHYIDRINRKEADSSEENYTTKKTVQEKKCPQSIVSLSETSTELANIEENEDKDTILPAEETVIIKTTGEEEEDFNAINEDWINTSFEYE